MKELYNKYANLLLEVGLKIKNNQPLVILAPIESFEFIREITKVAYQKGVKEIYYDWYDEELKELCLNNIDKENINKNSFWNKSIYNKYAKKDSAFLLLLAASNKMTTVDSEKLKIATKTSIKSKKDYRELQENNKISWCIASVATKEWADMLFPNEEMAYQKLWNTIFDICLINEENPIKEWHKKVEDNLSLCKKLTDYKIKELHYTNSLGTNLKIELSKEAKWCGGSSQINGNSLLVNIPTEEVFTTPNKYKTEGIVYCSKPLVYTGKIINDIVLEFKNGKVINYNSSSAYEELKSIIEFDNDSSYLGEVALVNNSNKIANKNIIFYETLFDENAASHIALGRGFKECYNQGEEFDDEHLSSLGYNKSKNHVDMMIGTSDMLIKGITFDNKEIIIYKDGCIKI